MRQIVTGEVVRAFTVVDEYLNVALCHYYFGKRKSFITLWRTKKFKLFNHHVLRELHPLQKLRLVKSIRAVPSGISRDIDRLRVLRNGIAHAFFPENLRKSQPIWKGEGIFGFKGLQCFCEDMERVFDYFWQRELAGSANEPTDAGRMRSRTPDAQPQGVLEVSVPTLYEQFRERWAKGCGSSLCAKRNMCACAAVGFRATFSSSGKLRPSQRMLWASLS